MTTTMISNLPRDLIEEIISRVPSKSMSLVRLTCKKWNTLTKSRSFWKMRIGKEASVAREGESRMVVLMDNDLHMMSFFIDKENPCPDLKGKLSCVNEQQVKISQVFHCEGLLLCLLRDDDTKVVVWNPYLGQTRWIKTRYSHRGQKGWCIDMYMYALGYVNKKKKSRRSHKILRLFDYDGVSEKRFTWYEIYDFDSNSWRTLDVSLEWFITFYQCGVSLKGNTYFCATIRDSGEEVLDNRLICFDYTSENFGPLLRFPFDAVDYVALSCVREEKLAVLLTHDELNPYERVVWITTKIDPENVSWSKFLILDTEPHDPISSSSFFIDEEKKVVMGFDEVGDWNHHTLRIVGEAGYLRKLVVGGKRNKNIRPSTHVCSFVPSVVKINQQHEGGDERKQEEHLEKRRYDEKMLRLAALESPVKEQSAGGKRKNYSKSAGGGKRR